MGTSLFQDYGNTRADRITADNSLTEDEQIAAYKDLILRMPKPNQYLLLYVLDMLSVFARRSDVNLMTAGSEYFVVRRGRGLTRDRSRDNLSTGDHCASGSRDVAVRACGEPEGARVFDQQAGSLFDWDGIGASWGIAGRGVR